MSVLLDTHIWIWWLTPGSPLPRAEREALDSIAEREPPSISAMSLWEAQMLHSKRKLSLPVLFERWLREAAGPDVVRLALLDVDVTIAVDTLPRNFHGDSADRIIVATARALGLPLATHDRTIRRSRIVRIWKP